MNTTKRRLPLLASAIALTLVTAACSSSGDESGGDTTATSPAATGAPTTDGAGGGTAAGTLIGGGASSQAAAMQAWQAGFQAANPDATVEYDPVGSGGGRETFLSGGSAFAGSDAALSDEEYQESIDRCAGDQGAINLPHYISPIAIAYNLPGVDTLNLTPENLAKIFTGDITSWNDEALVADNPDVELPDTAINAVHRSDESGTTKNFTDYLSAVAPDVWTYGAIEAWDSEGPGGGEGAPQTSGVVGAIEVGEGSIGYADASQIGDLPAARIQVGDQFVEYSPEAAAKIVDVSERLPGRSEYDFSYQLTRDTTEEGVYPIALVSYHIVCLQYEDQQTVDLVKAFMEYVGSEEGQAAAQEAAGSAPISAEIRDQLHEAISQISVGS